MSGHLDACLQEVMDRLVQLAGYSPPHPARGREVHRLRTVSVPAQRRAVRAGYGFVSESRAANLAAWDYIWNEGAYRELMCQALYFYQQSRVRPLTKPELTTILGWSNRCICWEHSDDLAKIYADVVEANPEWILPSLKRWNSAPNPWLRRMSMTSLIEYARKRRRFLPYEELMAFVLPLIDDDAFYVQKGLGWTVREIGNAYPAQFATFMTGHAARLSPQAWTGATKNMSQAEKARLMAIRRRG
jgi:3-methyladenine DNA glycosylase AlkD